MKGPLAAGATPAPSRRQRRSDETRGRLLDACLAVMLEHGYDSMSLGVVTERADLGTGTLYLHFRDKRALYEAMVRREVERTFQRWQESEAEQAKKARPGAASGPDELAASLKRLVVVTLEAFAEDPRRARLLLLDGPPVENWLLKDLGETLAPLVGGDPARAELIAQLSLGAVMAACRWVLVQPVERLSTRKMIEVVSGYCETGAAGVMARPPRRRRAALTRNGKRD